MMSLILIGLSGSGKTTCGQMLSDRTGWEFIDTDAVIEVEHGLTVADLFREYGEEHFRRLETDLLLRISNKSNLNEAAAHGRVIATGGGMPITPGNLACLRALGSMVYLETGIPVLVRRLIADTRRPLLISDSSENREEQIARRLNTLAAQREPIYSQAQMIIRTDDLSPSNVVSKLLEIIAWYQADHSASVTTPAARFG